MKTEKGNNQFIISMFLMPVFLLTFFISSLFINHDIKIAKADDQEEIEEELEDIEDELEEKNKKKETIEEQLGKIENNIRNTQLEINKTNEAIDQFDNEIEKKGESIDQALKDLEYNKKTLGEYLRVFRRYNQEMGFFILGSDTSLSEYFIALESYENIQNKIGEVLNQVEEERARVEKEKKEIEEKKEEKEETYEKQAEQKQFLVYQEDEKQQTLARTKASISEITSKMSKLKRELSSLLGDGYDTDDIKEAIKHASKVTGVSKGFLFGMLSMESGLGRYTGGCYYKESNMNDTRKKYFKEICEDLDYNYKKQKVSCPPKSYAGTGGAMGVAQFMPDTWKGYEDRIASATGKKVPDPWDLFDGVMAMAIKLENDGAAKDGKVKIKNPCNSKKVKVDWEDYAAMRYLGWSCYAYTNYAPAIQNLKDGYDDL